MIAGKLIFADYPLRQLQAGAPWRLPHWQSVRSAVRHMRALVMS
jgi:hypothetical protein